MPVDPILEAAGGVAKPGETATPPVAKPPTETTAAPTNQTTAAPGTQTTAAPGTATTAAPAFDPLGGVEAKPPTETTQPPAAKTPEVLAAEKKAADEKAAADKAKADAPITFKPPEGSPLKEDVKAWGGIFKEAGLSSEQAQKLVDTWSKIASSPEAKAAMEKAALESKQAKVAADLAVSEALPKLGGANFKATVAAARSVLAQYDGGPEVSKLLVEQGLNAHPAFLRLFAAIRASHAEDSTGSRIGSASQTAPIDATAGLTQIQRQIAIQAAEDKARAARKA